MNRKQKKNLIRIIIAAVLLIFIKLVSLPAWLSVVLYLAAYIVIGYDILRKAFKGILNKQVFDENFLMAVATVGAIALAVYERSADLSEAVLPDRRAVPELRCRQEPPQHQRPDGHPPRLREYRKGRPA